MNRYRRHPYDLSGLGFLGDPEAVAAGEAAAVAAAQEGASPNEIVAQADAMRGTVAQSLASARAAAGSGGWPLLPPPERFKGKNALPVWPTVAILPDSAAFPIYTNRERVLFIDSDDQAGTAFNAQLIIPDWATVYAVSGACITQAVDVWANGELDVTVQFTRDSGDQLSTAPALFPAIVGTGENPMPIGTPGWAFMQNQSITVTGESLVDTYRIWIVFHTVESVATTNVGAARTREYHG